MGRRTARCERADRDMTRSHRSRLIAINDDLDLAQFREICSQVTDPASYPLASSIASNVPVYDGCAMLAAARDVAKRHQVMEEWYNCLLDGPGVFVIRGCEPNSDILDRADAAFGRIIAEERKGASERGDHFAPGGKNDRIWNSFGKLANVDPDAFVDYYANEIIAMASEAWLGPGYQMTAQVNVVKPGGAAQQPHRDYHLGFQSPQVASAFPVAHQVASQYLTLQGAIAHTDMPLASGPTLLLPFSQSFHHGYLAYRREPFVEFFHAHRIQLALQRGDAVLFNPALFHAAGDNSTTDFKRCANLLQISAAWSRPMESVDRIAALKLAYPRLCEITGHRLRAAVQAIADGYSFPTNLDKDPPPASGHCPATQQDLVLLALQEQWPQGRFEAALDAHRQKQTA